MSFLSDAMFWLSNGLLVPVLVLLLYLFVRSIFLLGTLFGTWQRHRKITCFFSPVVQGADRKSIEVLKAEVDSISLPAGFIITAKRLFVSPKAARNLLVSEYELTSENKLGIAKILTKFGPILGLMGTLIPMGPALVGLATGDISNMAYNMQVAFATTVLGLFASAVGYIAVHIMRSYNHRCLLWLDYLNDRLEEVEDAAMEASDRKKLNESKEESNHA